MRRTARPNIPTRVLDIGLWPGTVLDRILWTCPFQEIEMMKHNKLIAGLAAAGSLFAMNAAHAIAPAIALGVAALGGAAVGSTATQAANNPPAVAVVPSNPTVVMGGPPATVQEVIPAPRDGYTWQRGHFEIQNGVSAWMPGHWVANDVVIYRN
jgi:hypothetical protein